MIDRAGAGTAPSRAKADCPPDFEFSVLVMEKRMPASNQRRSGSGLPKFYAIKTVAETLEIQPAASEGGSRAAT
jgi:hypothetical protein